MIKFLIRSILIGATVLVILYVVISPLVSLYFHYADEIDTQEVLIILVTSLVIGALLNALYFRPLHFFAKFSLKTIANFYQEFLRFGAKYFAKENSSRPFETIVMVSLNDKIRVLAFLTNRLPDGSCLVYVPISRRLTSGFSLIVRGDSVTPANVTPEEFLKYVMTNGAFQLSNLSEL